MFEQAKLSPGERFYPSTHTRITQGKKREDGRKTFTFVISTGSEDRHGTRISPQGIDLEAFRSNPIVLADHDGSVMSVIGRAINVEVKGDKLIAQMEFDEEDELARKIKGKVERGFVNATSIGFMIKDLSFDEERDLVNIDQAELVEFSIVAVPSNRDALALSRNLTELKEQIAELREEVRKTRSNDVPTVAGLSVGADTWKTIEYQIDTTTGTEINLGVTEGGDADATSALETEERSIEDSTAESDESRSISPEADSPDPVAIHENETAEGQGPDAELAKRVMSRSDLEELLERKIEQVVPQIRQRVRRSLGKE